MSLTLFVALLAALLAALLWPFSSLAAALLGCAIFALGLWYFSRTPEWQGLSELEVASRLDTAFTLKDCLATFVELLLEPHNRKQV